MFKLRGLVLLLCVFMLTLPVFAQDAPTVGLSSSDELGPYMVGPDGMTLYIFTPDPLDQSVCSGQCLERWPALTVESADDLTAAEGIPGELGTITREDDGTLQVTYNGLPLYYWVRDEAVGDTTGNRVGHVWWVMPPATVYAAPQGELGNILVGPTGMTLYTFKDDEPGVSNCTGGCLEHWPALTVDSADAEIVHDVRLPGEFGTIEREDDGTFQVTYNGWPLYYYAEDTARGDANGEGAGDKWYTVVPETVTTSDTGDSLVSYDGMTLYTFANDTAGETSTCTSEDCTAAWAAFTVLENDRLAAGEGIEGELGTVETANGGRQVTYNGWPLYFYREDTTPGAAGGVSENWPLATP
jgi:predicted lipoprotein with Yx(FWY)xxD motif